MSRAAIADLGTQSSCTHQTIYPIRAALFTYIPKITVPSLLLNARNDPFLTPSCFPEKEARESELFHLEAPSHGGHAGFAPMNGDNLYWTEKRAIKFLNTPFD